MIKIIPKCATLWDWLKYYDTYKWWDLFHLNIEIFNSLLF